jgi:hypothetical protein
VVTPLSLGPGTVDTIAETPREVTEIERQQLAMETLGLSLTEGKTLLLTGNEFHLILLACL